MKKQVLLIVMALFSIGTNAYDIVYDGIYYNVNSAEKTASVTYPINVLAPYNGDIIIPSEITSKGGHIYRVTSIGDGAFQNCSGLTSLTIPESVTSIGRNAFSRSFALSSIYISSLEAWCNIKFKEYLAAPGCNGGIHLYLNGREVKDLVIPNTVRSIGEYAFQGCIGLTSVTIPNSVESIGFSAFAYCTRLTSIAIPNSVRGLGGCLFNGCESLTSVILGKNVISIGAYSFSDCTNLKDVYCHAPNVLSVYEDKWVPEKKLSETELNNVTLHVPASLMESYSAKETWNVFGNIVALPQIQYIIDGKTYKITTYNVGDTVQPEGIPVKKGYTFSGWSTIPTSMPEGEVIVTGSFTIIDDIQDINVDEGGYQIYTLNGKEVKTLQKGVNILRMSDGTTKKVVAK